MVIGQPFEVGLKHQMGQIKRDGGSKSEYIYSLSYFIICSMQQKWFVKSWLSERCCGCLDQLLQVGLLTCVLWAQKMGLVLSALETKWVDFSWKGVYEQTYVLGEK